MRAHRQLAQDPIHPTYLLPCRARVLVYLCLLLGLELLLDNFPRLFFPARRVILLAGQTQVGGQR
jgi:hypothetical protein